MPPKGSGIHHVDLDPDGIRGELFSWDRPVAALGAAAATTASTS